MAMPAATTFEFEGKEFALWTEKQLEGVNREALKQRAMNLREHVGQDRLPPMPRHPEALAGWILAVQNALTGGGKPAPMGDPAPNGGGGGGRAGPMSSDPVRPTTPSSDAAQAYVEAKKNAEKSRLRNQGGGMAEVFGGASR